MSDLNKLYNSKVKSVQIVQRDLNSKDKKNVSFVHHQGARITLENGDKYLVHNPGPGQQAVITSASNMKDGWESIGTRSVDTSVGKVMETAQSGGIYSLTSNNCMHVAKKAYEMGEPSFYNKKDLCQSIVQHNAAWQTIDYDPRDYFKDAPQGGSGGQGCLIM